MTQTEQTAAVHARRDKALAIMKAQEPKYNRACAQAVLDNAVLPDEPAELRAAYAEIDAADDALQMLANQPDQTAPASAKAEVAALAAIRVAFNAQVARRDVLAAKVAADAKIRNAQKANALLAGDAIIAHEETSDEAELRGLNEIIAHAKTEMESRQRDARNRVFKLLAARKGIYLAAMKRAEAEAEAAAKAFLIAAAAAYGRDQLHHLLKSGNGVLWRALEIQHGGLPVQGAAHKFEGFNYNEILEPASCEAWIQSRAIPMLES